jgi:hypothetical protein
VIDYQLCKRCFVSVDDVHELKRKSVKYDNGSFVGCAWKGKVTIVFVRRECTKTLGSIFDGIPQLYLWDWVLCPLYAGFSWC